MDVFSAIIVAVPLITPIAATFGIDPVSDRPGGYVNGRLQIHGRIIVFLDGNESIC
jgi:hypothetical protein